jgi:hypothetical protein
MVSMLENETMIMRKFNIFLAKNNKFNPLILSIINIYRKLGFLWIIRTLTLLVKKSEVSGNRQLTLTKMQTIFNKS